MSPPGSSGRLDARRCVTEHARAGLDRLPVMAHGEAHGGRPLADEVGGGDLAWLGLRQTDFPTPAPGDLPAGNPLGPSTTCDLYSNNTQPAKKTRERHYDQWIYLGQDKNKRADAREQIGAPVLVRRLAHHIPARQNQTDGQRRKPPFDRAADRRILGALPELYRQNRRAAPPAPSSKLWRESHPESPPVDPRRLVPPCSQPA